MVYKVYLPPAPASFPLSDAPEPPARLDVSPPNSLTAARALAEAEGGYVVEFDEEGGHLVNGRRV